MIITKKKLSRRTVLRGLGASLSLPLLDSMIPALSVHAQEEEPTKRLGVVYVPNGMAMKAWTPDRDGKDFEITRIMKPMEAYRNRMLVITGLDGPTSNAGVHASASTRFLTGAIPRRAESDLRASVSIDQLMARHYGSETQLGSLELAMDENDVFGSCAVSYTHLTLPTILRV